VNDRNPDELVRQEPARSAPSLATRIANLSPQQRELLQRRLRAQGIQDVEAPLVAGRRSGVYPLSSAQQRLWLLHQMEPDNTAYSVVLATRLRGALNIAALEASLNEVVRRHESLRTTFAVRDGDPAQVITPSLRVPLQVIDLRSLPAAERGNESLRLAAIENQRAWDLTHGPLVQALLYRLEQEELMLFLRLHHIISDGWSIGVLARELAALYPALAAGKPSPLREPLLQ
jgi:hypothetical protein